MPLQIKVVRNNEVVPQTWDWRTLSAIYTACIRDQDPDQEYADGKTFGELEDGQYIDFSAIPIYYLHMPKVPLIARGEQTLLHDYEYEWMELRAGDRIEACRV